MLPSADTASLQPGQLLANDSCMILRELTLLHPGYAAQQGCGYPYCADKRQYDADGGKDGHDAMKLR